MNGRLVGMLVALVAMLRWRPASRSPRRTVRLRSRPRRRRRPPARKSRSTSAPNWWTAWVSARCSACWSRRILKTTTKYFIARSRASSSSRATSTSCARLVTPVENAPADASSLQYTLVEVVSKGAIAAESADSAGLEGPDVAARQRSRRQRRALVEVPAGVRGDGDLADGSVSGSSGCNNYGAAYLRSTARA